MQGLLGDSYLSAPQPDRKQNLHHFRRQARAIIFTLLIVDLKNLRLTLIRSGEEEEEEVRDLTCSLDGKEGTRGVGRKRRRRRRRRLFERKNEASFVRG